MVYLILAFAIAVAFEVYYARKHELPVYDFAATISHFGLGAGQTAIGALFATASLAFYAWLYDTYHFLNLDENSVALTAALVVIADFCYYVAHRMSHRVNFFVAAHVVHHQALDFNHGSALRQSWTSRIVLFVFYAPLALVGIPLKPLAAAMLVNLFVQFFSHNGVIRRKLGWLEYVLVTPRSHRVHHGTNAPYIDKNFAGIFIFWDRLFGSYVDLDESNPVRIGPVDGTNPYDPVSANLNYYGRILFVARRRPTLWKKISVWFETPESLEEELARLGYVESSPTPALSAYSRDAKIAIGLLTTATVGTLIYYMANKDAIGFGERATLTALVLAGAWVTGRVVIQPGLVSEGKKVRS